MIRKFMSTVALGSLFVGGLAATQMAFAQPPASGAEGARRGGMMAMADANKDGAITRAEWIARVEARFAKMDVDRDGKITQADRDARRAQRLDERFAALDTDKNDQISKAEFVAGNTVRRDRGAQGPRAERGEGRGWSGRHHGGSDRGMMRGGQGANRGMTRDQTKAEFMAHSLAQFDKADANKDGKVTAEEWSAARANMRAEWRAHRAAPASTPANK